MDGMTNAAHAKPARRDLLWVLVLILTCGLLEVWASWLSIGAVSGFPKLGRMTTGWILPVTAEAYWSAALFAWLAVPAGPRSASFAKWSAAAMFALSLAGQESDHLLAAAARTAPPSIVVGFVTALPLISVALIAILIHLRQKDRAEAAEAARVRAEAEEVARQASAEAARRESEAARAAAEEAAAADERTALRTELEAAHEALATVVEPLREALAAAQRDAEQANAKAESLAAKLAARKPNRTRTKAPNAGRRKDPNAARNGGPRTAPNAAPETEVPDDFDARAEALEIWLANPGISGKDLGASVGLGERWGQLRKTEFRNASTGSERSDERS